jgi:hypothetical protein
VPSSRYVRIVSSPLKFREGFFVARKEVVADNRRGGGIDHLERPLGFVLKADDGNFDRYAVPLPGARVFWPLTPLGSYVIAVKLAQKCDEPVVRLA